MKNKGLIIVNSVFMLIGIGSILFLLFFEFSLFFLMIGTLLLFVPFMMIRKQFKQSVPLEKKTYEWYKEKYPNNVQGDIVTCFTCENNLLDMRPLINEIFQNEIYCTECKKTLYYLH